MDQQWEIFCVVGLVAAAMLGAGIVVWFALHLKSITDDEQQSLTNKYTKRKP